MSLVSDRASAARWLVGLVLLALAAHAAASGSANALARASNARQLRVCADPNNLPFSNREQVGFENELARLVARELARTLTYTWFPQRRGFIRNTLAAGLCDVLMGVPARFERVLTTAPYYRSSYVFVTRADFGASPVSLDDRALKTLRIGLHVIGDDYQNVPPAAALAARGIVDNVRGFSVYGDYSKPNPPSALIDAVANAEIDVAIAWGPLAGYFARREPTKLSITPVTPEAESPRLQMAFDIAMGVRSGDKELQRALDAVLRKRQRDVHRLLVRFGVPLFDPRVPFQPNAIRHEER